MTWSNITSPFPRYGTRRWLLSLLSSLVLIPSGMPPAEAQTTPPKLKVVTTFSILADLARNVGGDRAEVSSLVGPDGDVHVYAPTPSDVAAVKDARLLIVNGLGLEGWLPRLVQSSGGHAVTVVASDGITPRVISSGDKPRQHDGGSTDPHAWQAVTNAEIYVGNIRDAMTAADPANAVAYKANAAAYLTRLAALDDEVRRAIAKIPDAHRKVISAHNAFGYFADAYGVTFLASQGVSTDSEPSARDIAAIIRQIKADKIPAIFQENITDPRLIQQIASETGAKIGGKLYSDSLTGEHGEAPTYVGMIEHNLKAITGALAD